MVRRLRATRNRWARAGLATVWVAVLGFVVLAFVGLAMDRSLLGLTAQQLQATADAAALAGALRLKTDLVQARDQAVATAAANRVATAPINLNRNDANDAAGDIVFGRYHRFDSPPYFDPTEDPAGWNAVKVVARRTSDSNDGPLDLVFGPMAGVNQANIARTAIAMIGGSTGAGLITLCGDCECALKLSGTTDLIISTAPGYDGDASMQVNSDALGCPKAAVCGSGNSLTIVAPELNIVAAGDEADCWNGYTPEAPPYINPGSPYVPDPLAGLPDPTWDPASDLGAITSSGTYGPGYYSGGIRLTSSGDNVTLSPGVYVVDRAGGPASGLFVNGGNLTANEVLFYVIDDGEVYLGGSGIITITPPTSGIYEGISIFQARDNTQPSTIIGSTTMDLQGTYYFPASDLEVGGTGIALGNQLIAWTMWIHGTGTFDIAYDGSNPTTGYKVWLVE